MTKGVFLLLGVHAIRYEFDSAFLLFVTRQMTFLCMPVDFTADIIIM